MLPFAINFETGIVFSFSLKFLALWASIFLLSTKKNVHYHWLIDPAKSTKYINEYHYFLRPSITDIKFSRPTKIHIIIHISPVRLNTSTSIHILTSRLLNGRKSRLNISLQLTALQRLEITNGFINSNSFNRFKTVLDYVYGSLY